MFRDLPRLIDFVTAQQVAKTPKTKAVSELLQLFVTANGHDLADGALLQDAVSVAYSMLVIHNELRLAEDRGSKSLKQLLADSSATTEAVTDEPVPAPKKKRKTK